MMTRTTTTRIHSKFVAIVILACLASIRLVSDLEDEWKSSSFSIVTTTSTRRFPKYGTPEFSRQCPWTKFSSSSSLTTTTRQQQQQQNPSCILWARPPLNAWEGMAQWLSQVASGFLLVQQQHSCRLVLDYGPNIDIHHVIAPPQQEDGFYNWTVPTGWSVEDCRDEAHCHVLSDVGAIIQQQDMPMLQQKFGLSFVNVPFYRHYFDRIFERPNEESLRRVLPGFRVQNGFACAIGSLFQLAPGAAEYESDLFSSILPTLRDKEALVLAFYIRTGLTDVMARMEEAGGKDDKLLSERDYSSRVKPFLRCAESLEKRMLSSASSHHCCTRIVWLVVSDSPQVKSSLYSSHHGTTVVYHHNLDGSRHIPRQVVHTQTKGRHTRQQARPSTTDFAEAFVDWYLLGESDLVLTRTMFTFGKLASLRTVRPLYDVSRCQERLVPAFVD